MFSIDGVRVNGQCSIGCTALQPYTVRSPLYK